jgi:hypothetical protein
MINRMVDGRVAEAWASSPTCGILQPRRMKLLVGLNWLKEHRHTKLQVAVAGGHGCR